ncbi:hypothetical protein CR513_19140, partial [Mucuna pruriens]
MAVDRQVSLAFTLGKYSYEIICDVVVLIEATYILLGKSWQFDRKVIYDGVTSKFSFVHMGESSNENENKEEKKQKEQKEKKIESRRLRENKKRKIERKTRVRVKRKVFERFYKASRNFFPRIYQKACLQLGALRTTLISIWEQLCLIKKIKTIFRAMPKELKVTYVAYMLIGEVEYWWHGAQQPMVASLGKLLKPFSQNELRRYCLEPKGIKVHKNEELRHNLKGVIILMAIWEFLELMEKAKVMECLECSHKIGKTLRMESSRFKKEHYQKKLYNRDFHMKGIMCFNFQRPGHMARIAKGQPNQNQP